MSEEQSELFGKLEVTPGQGLQLNIINRSDIKKDDNVIILKKDEKGFYIVKGIFKVLENEKEIRLQENEDELGDLKVRKALAAALVRMNKDAIMEQSLIVAEQALARKPVKKLHRFFKNKKSGSELKMKTKVGCVFLEIGDEETVL